jgi:hypothetical protein
MKTVLNILKVLSQKLTLKGGKNTDLDKGPNDELIKPT